MTEEKEFSKEAQLLINEIKLRIEYKPIIDQILDMLDEKDIQFIKDLVNKYHNQVSIDILNAKVELEKSKEQIIFYEKELENYIAERDIIWKQILCGMV